MPPQVAPERFRGFAGGNAFRRVFLPPPPALRRGAFPMGNEKVPMGTEKVPMGNETINPTGCDTLRRVFLLPPGIRPPQTHLLSWQCIYSRRGFIMNTIPPQGIGAVFEGKASTPYEK